ncbi:DEAD-box type RNA helicase, partial [Dimargaris verticillata]
MSDPDPWASDAEHAALKGLLVQIVPSTVGVAQGSGTVATAATNTQARLAALQTFLQRGLHYFLEGAGATYPCWWCTPALYPITQQLLHLFSLPSEAAPSILQYRGVIAGQLASCTACINSYNRGKTEYRVQCVQLYDRSTVDSFFNTVFCWDLGRVWTGLYAGCAALCGPTAPGLQALRPVAALRPEDDPLLKTMAHLIHIGVQPAVTLSTLDLVELVSPDTPVAFESLCIFYEVLQTPSYLNHPTANALFCLLLHLVLKTRMLQIGDRVMPGVIPLLLHPWPFVRAWACSAIKHAQRPITMVDWATLGPCLESVLQRCRALMETCHHHQLTPPDSIQPLVDTLDGVYLLWTQVQADVIRERLMPLHPSLPADLLDLLTTGNQSLFIQALRLSGHLLETLGTEFWALANSKRHEPHGTSALVSAPLLATTKHTPLSVTTVILNHPCVASLLQGPATATKGLDGQDTPTKKPLKALNNWIAAVVRSLTGTGDSDAMWAFLWEKLGQWANPDLHEYSPAHRAWCDEQLVHLFHYYYLDWLPAATDQPHAAVQDPSLAWIHRNSSILAHALCHAASKASMVPIATDVVKVLVQRDTAQLQQTFDELNELMAALTSLDPATVDPAAVAEWVGQQPVRFTPEGTIALCSTLLSHPLPKALFHPVLSGQAEQLWWAYGPLLDTIIATLTTWSVPPTAPIFQHATALQTLLAARLQSFAQRLAILLGSTNPSHNVKSEPDTDTSAAQDWTAYTPFSAPMLLTRSGVMDVLRLCCVTYAPIRLTVLQWLTRHVPTPPIPLSHAFTKLLGHESEYNTLVALMAYTPEDCVVCLAELMDIYRVGIEKHADLFQHTARLTQVLAVGVLALVSTVVESPMGSTTTPRASGASQGLSGPTYNRVVTSLPGLWLRLNDYLNLTFFQGFEWAEQKPRHLVTRTMNVQFATAERILSVFARACYVTTPLFAEMQFHQLVAHQLSSALETVTKWLFVTDSKLRDHAFALIGAALQFPIGLAPLLSTHSGSPTGASLASSDLVTESTDMMAAYQIDHSILSKLTKIAQSEEGFLSYLTDRQKATLKAHLGTFMHTLGYPVTSQWKTLAAASTALAQEVTVIATDSVQPSPTIVDEASTVVVLDDDEASLPGDLSDLEELHIAIPTASKALEYAPPAIPDDTETPKGTANLPPPAHSHAPSPTIPAGLPLVPSLPPSSPLLASAHKPPLQLTAELAKYSAAKYLGTTARTGANSLTMDQNQFEDEFDDLDDEALAEMWDELDPTAAQMAKAMDQHANPLLKPFTKSTKPLRSNQSVEVVIPMIPRPSPLPASSPFNPAPSQVNAPATLAEPTQPSTDTAHHVHFDQVVPRPRSMAARSRTTTKTGWLTDFAKPAAAKPITQRPSASAALLSPWQSSVAAKSAIASRQAAKGKASRVRPSDLSVGSFKPTSLMGALRTDFIKERHSKLARLPTNPRPTSMGGLFHQRKVPVLKVDHNRIKKIPAPAQPSKAKPSSSSSSSDSGSDSSASSDDENGFLGLVKTKGKVDRRTLPLESVPDTTNMGELVVIPSENPQPRRGIKLLDLPLGSGLKQSQTLNGAKPTEGIPILPKHANPSTSMNVDMASLHRQVLGWPIHSKTALPKFAPHTYTHTSLRQVTNRFTNTHDYIKTFEPLLLLEAWQQLQRAKEEIGPLKALKAELQSRSSVNDFQELALKMPSVDARTFTDHDLIVLSECRQQSNGPGAGLDDTPILDSVGSDKCTLLAKVQGTNYSRESSELVVRVWLNGPEGMNKLSMLYMGSKWFVWKLSVLSTLQREYSGLHGLNYYGLRADILNGSVAPVPEFSSAALVRCMKTYGVNQPQAEAILTACQREQGFTLIQGPPGTGKTRTILGLVGAFLSPVHHTPALKRPSGAAKAMKSDASEEELGFGDEHRIVPNFAGDAARPNKLLICAPSNAAVDEIVKRLKEGVLNADGVLTHPKMVRMGVSDSMNAQTKDVGLDHLIDRELDKLGAAFLDDLTLPTTATLDAKLSDYLSDRRQLTSSKDVLDRSAARQSEIHKQIDQVVSERKETETALKALMAQTSPSEREIRKMESKVKQLKKQQYQLTLVVNEEKERQALMNRGLETCRRKVRNQILQNTDILCCTLSGSGHDALSNIGCQFGTVIIDEAAQSVELSALIPLRYGCQRCILVGDPNQLPPTVLSTDAIKYQYDQSLFVRLQRVNPSAVNLLSIQYRMHPDISAFPSRLFYDSKLRDGLRMAEKQQAVWHQGPTPFPPFCFYNVIEGRETKGRSRSLYNQAEARAILEIVCQLCRAYPFESFYHRIGVITPYKLQLRELKMQFVKRFGKAIFDAIDFNTVDGFQGQEKDIIIFSCVRAAESGANVGFLADVRRMNVALTRARKSLFIVGHSNFLQGHPLWQKLIADAKQRQVHAQFTFPLFRPPIPRGIAFPNLFSTVPAAARSPATKLPGASASGGQSEQARPTAETPKPHGTLLRYHQGQAKTDQDSLTYSTIENIVENAIGRPLLPTERVAASPDVEVKLNSKLAPPGPSGAASQPKNTTTAARPTNHSSGAHNQTRWSGGTSEPPPGQMDATNTWPNPGWGTQGPNPLYRPPPQLQPRPPPPRPHAFSITMRPLGRPSPQLNHARPGMPFPSNTDITDPRLAPIKRRRAAPNDNDGAPDLGPLAPAAKRPNLFIANSSSRSNLYNNARQPSYRPRGISVREKVSQPSWQGNTRGR